MHSSYADSRRAPRRRGRWWWLSLSICLFALGVSSPTVAQVDEGPLPLAGRSLSQYQVQSWDDSDGLPQNTIQALTQTNDGYLWIGTQNGVVRFDGVRFTTFGREASPALNRPYIWALAPARDGGLWIGTEETGITHRRDSEYRSWDVADGLPSNWVSVLREASNGTLWIGTRDSGAAKLVNGRIHEVPVVGNVVWSITEDAHGVIWIATDQALNRVDAAGTTQVSGLPGAPRAVAAAADSGVWVGTTAGLVLYRGGRAGMPITAADGLPTSHIISLGVDRTGVLWAGTTGGVARYHEGRVSTLADSTLAEPIFNLHVDHEGSVWFGTYASGLTQMRETPFIPVGVPEGLATEYIMSIRQSSEGDMWVGTGGSGVNVLGPDGIESYTAQSGHLPANAVFAMLESSDGTMWVGTPYGLASFRNGSSTIHGQAQGLKNLDVRVVVEDHSGALWVGTRGGLQRLRPEPSPLYTTANGLADNFVVTMLETRDSALWVATRTGITRFRDGRFRRFTLRHGLPDAGVSVLHEDAKGRLWLGSEVGLTRFDGQRFVTAGTDDGLCDSWVNSILEDDAGDLWIGSNRGIFKVELENFEAFARTGTPLPCVLYGTAEGMRSRETNGATNPSAWRASDGRMWFPTLKGLVIVDPDNPSPSGSPPPVFIEEVTIAGRPHGTLPAELPAGTDRIELRYTGLSFSAPERVQFRYRLDGVDEDWIDAGTQRTATYTGLTPGKYTFRVTAANAAGEWNSESATYSFAVLPIFYETLWFRLFVGALIATALVFAYRRRIRILQDRQAGLEALVAERTLAEAQYRDLFENATDAVFTTDTEGAFTALNRQAEQLLGIPASAAGSSNLRSLLPDSAAGQALYEEWMAGRGDANTPVEIRTRNGRRVPAEVSTRLLMKEGYISGVQGVMRDVSERAGLERQLRQSQKMEAVGQLAGGVAHDFNNLLTVIRGSGELLLEDGRLALDQKSDVQEILEAADHATSLTRQLLAFSRRQIVQARVTDINEVIRRVQKMVSRLIGEDIEVRLQLDRSPCPVLADPGQIEQVLLNLAVNARDAMPAGGNLTITTAIIDVAHDAQAPVRSTSGQGVVLTFADTGGGMDAATQARIFEPFFTTKAPGQGTGLGLSTVYGIVQQAGGQIICRSDIGRGTEFRIYLPLTTAADVGETDGDRAAPAGGNETILLVEDDDAVRSLMQRLLKRQGYNVLPTTNGEEALAMAEDYPGAIHLLMTDMVMPGMNGIAVAASLRAQRPGVRVLLVSGYTDDEIMRRGERDAGLAFLNKPFTAEELGRAVRDAIDREVPAGTVSDRED